MKKIFLIAVLVLAGITANAQFYIGGSLGFYENSEKNKDGKKTGTSYSTFSIAPEAGYMFSEKMDFGLSYLFSNDGRKSYYNGELGSNTTAKTWGVSPYIRYSLITFGNFDVLGKLALYFSENSNEYTSYNSYANYKDKYTYTTFGANLSPLLFYNFSKHISIYTQLNFLGLDLSSTTEKSNGSKTGSTSTFDFEANTDNIVTFDQIRIGFVYRF